MKFARMMFRKLHRFLENHPKDRPCDHPACSEQGFYRALHSRLTNFHSSWLYFCLDPIRLYNAKWNYFKGMKKNEIEEKLQAHTFSLRLKKPLGSWAKRSLYQHPFSYPDPFGLFNQKKSHPTRQKDEEQKALDTLNLGYPYTLEMLQKQYRLMVKRHHPDRHQGCKSAEEKIKQINQAYYFLKKNIF